MTNQTLINQITSVVKANGAQGITGTNLQGVLVEMAKTNDIDNGLGLSPITAWGKNTSDNKYYFGWNQAEQDWEGDNVSLNEIFLVRNSGDYVLNPQNGTTVSLGEGDFIRCTQAGSVNAGGYTTYPIFERVQLDAISEILRLREGVDENTAKITELGQEINGDLFKQPTGEDRIYGNLASDASWNEGNQYSLILDVDGLQGKRITATLNFTATKQYAFLNTYVPNGQSTFAEGCSRENTYPVDVTIPNDANYIYLLVPYTVTPQIPTITITPLLSTGIKTDVDRLTKGSVCVKWDGEKYSIYQRIAESDKYVMLEIIHNVDNSDIEYTNLWRLSTNGGIYSYNGEIFSSLGVKLLETSENEFAFKYNRALDFTGGYHGDERIDIDNSCYVDFYVDGVAITDIDMQSSFEIWCNSFYYRQRSTLHQTTEEEGTFIANHPIIAYHTKVTIFENQGYTTKNRIDIDLTNSNRESLVTDTIFTGLACIHKDVSTIVIVDTGNVIETSSNNNIISFDGVENPLSISLEYYSYNQNKNASCYVISKELTKPQSGNNYLKVWDRPTDTKYYAYAPNRILTTGDVYMSEMTIKWNFTDY